MLTTDPVMTVLAVIALPEEHDAFCEYFEVVRDLTDGGTLIVSEHASPGRGTRLISVLSEGMGSENALAATDAICAQYNPDIVVCIGIAGSMSNDAKIGHVCVSNEIIDVLHNAKIVPAKPKKRRAGRRGTMRSTADEIALCPKNYAVNIRLLAEFRFLRSHPKRRSEYIDWQKESADRVAATTEVEDNPPAAPELHVGPIICAQVTASANYKKQLLDVNRKAIAVETGSGGIFRASEKHGRPAITIRGICDNADARKNALEKESGNAFREIAMKNACGILKRQMGDFGLSNALLDISSAQSGRQAIGGQPSPSQMIATCESAVSRHLESTTPDYKNRAKSIPLPIPRIRRLAIEDDVELLEEHEPTDIVSALAAHKSLFIKLPKSYPDNALPWAISLALFKSELDGRQPFPIPFAGDLIGPPNHSIQKAADLDFSITQIEKYFAPVFIVNEPPFGSRTRLAHLVSEFKKYDGAHLIIVSKSDSPVARIDGFKADIGATDFVTTAVPFREIATYLESALELEPGEADAAATRLDDTFSKFRLHTHPAYFIGIQENTISALINANQRAELIQLAVDGLLSFIVASDQTEVPMGRTTREEYLSNLAYKIKYEKRSYSRTELIEDAIQFAEQRALEIDAIEFTQGFFKFGVLTESTGRVSFSLSFLESYLLSQRLIANPHEAHSYFDMKAEDFDYFTFDLYAERGAHQSVTSAVIELANEALSHCIDAENVFVEKGVRPRTLGNAKAYVSSAKEMARAIETISERTESPTIRSEKQRLIDARSAVSSTVGKVQRRRRDDLSSEVQKQFQRLDLLSRSQLLLATMLGSGAERLDRKAKMEAAQKLLSVSERFLHFWTLDRLRVNFAELREELLSDESIAKMIEQFDLFEDAHDEIKDNLGLFLDDQELRALSGPLASILDRISSYAGVRSLKPIVEEIKTSDATEALLRGAWFMDVESKAGKKVLKHALQQYKGSELLRLVLATHLVRRLFWHHWEKNPKSDFTDVARYSIKPMGLTTRSG